MDYKFKINGQNLKRLDSNSIITSSRNEFFAVFHFDKSWHSIEPKTATFEKDDNIISVAITDNKCKIPWEVMESAGEIKLCVSGGDFVPTNKVEIKVTGEPLKEGLAPTTASPSVYSYIVELSENIESNYNNMKSIIDTYTETVTNSQNSINQSAASAEASANNASNSAQEAKTAAEGVLEIRTGIENATIINDSAIAAEKISFLTLGVNKINEKNIGLGFYDIAGRWNAADSYATIWAKVKPNTTYSLWGGVIFQLLYFSKEIYSFGFFKAAHNSGYVLDSEAFGNSAAPDTPILITTPENCEYITVTVGTGRNGKYAYENNIMLVEGESYPEKYYPFEFKVDDSIAGTTDINTYAKYKNKKILYMGDSITALGGERGWVEHCNNILKPELYVNIAVSSARWCDYSDTVYDGAPVSGSHNNTIGNQVEKILRGKDSENENYEEVAEYSDFDIICIALGTNDSIGSITENIEDAFTIGDTVLSADSVDRTTIKGAFRYAIEKLQGQYPNAQIFICTPIQGYITTKVYENTKKIGRHLIDLADRMSVEYINTFECGICGLYELSGENGRDLIDGLHPNASGAKKIGTYNANAIIQKYKNFDK